MVRIGKYSPNNPNYLGAACGILGLGEYEEKRKYYDEQRKLEYQQYLAQQSLKLTAVKGKVGRRIKPVCDETDELGESLRRTDSIQRHASTQTESLGKDATTNTELNPELTKAELTKQYNLLKDNGDPIRRTRISPIPRNITNYERNHIISPSSFGALSSESENTSDIRKLASPRDFPLKYSPDLVKRGVLKDFSYQDSCDSLSLGMQAKTARRRWRDNAASYERDLRAQVEERQRLKRELEEKEKQEALARDRWVAEEEERALARQRVEEEKAKAREDLLNMRMDDFFRRREELKKEAEGRRHVDLRQRILESHSSTQGIDSDNVRERHSPKDMPFGPPDQVMNSPRKCLNSPLIPALEYEAYRNIYSSPKKSTRERGTNAQTDEAIHLEDKWRLSPVKRRDGIQMPSGPSLSARDHCNNSSKGSLRNPASARFQKTQSVQSGMITPMLISVADNPVKDVNASHNTEEKIPHDRIPLTNLAEIRRQLKMDQMRMEDAIRRRNIDLSNTSDSVNN